MSVASMISRWGQTAQFFRNTMTVTPTGRRSTTPVANGPPIACAVQPASGDVRNIYGTMELLVDAVLYVESDKDVQEGDSVVVGTATYGVVGVRNQAGLDRLWAVDVRRTTNVGSP